MRKGRISDEMWEMYLTRVVQKNDPRLRAKDSPFMKHDVNFIVHRHKIRVMRSLENAKEQSRIKQAPLYAVQAHDEVVRDRYSCGRTSLAARTPTKRRTCPAFCRCARE